MIRTLIGTATYVILVLLMLAPYAPLSAETPASSEKEIEHSDRSRLWCAEHALFEDQCHICHPELREKGRLWCNEHERYEDRCWLCHPELEDKKRPYCEVHKLYADECAHLHRSQGPAGSDSAGYTLEKAEQLGAERSTELFCREHNLPEVECGICHPELLQELRGSSELKIRLASSDSAELLDLQTVKPRRDTVDSRIKTVGELRFNQNLTAHVVAPVKGVIKEVHADLGARVNAGDSLLSMWSPAIAEAASKALLAAQTFNRLERLRAQGISSAKELQQAAAENRAATQRLQSLGFSEVQIDSLKESADAPAVLTVAAPFAGEVVERHSVQGEFIESGASLYTITDRSTLWAMLKLPAAELAAVQLGQSVELRTAAFPGEVFEGEITWVSASIDSKTRMATVRVEVANEDGRLRNHMFVDAEILSRSAEGSYLIPRSAVHKIEDVEFVFIRLAADLFQIQAVTLGAHSGDFVEIKSGISADDEVVTERSHVLKSQFLISRLGAGCVH